MRSTLRGRTTHSANVNTCEFASTSIVVGEDGGGVGGGRGGGGEGASRVTLVWTSMTDKTAGGSSMVTPNTLLIAWREFVFKALAADSTWLAPPEVSVATTVRITLPALTVT
eukprot:scaffold136661_cov99-Phaeocystis_antarctica.AAC.1